MNPELILISIQMIYSIKNDRKVYSETPVTKGFSRHVRQQAQLSTQSVMCSAHAGSGEKWCSRSWQTRSFRCTVEPNLFCHDGMRHDRTRPARGQQVTAGSYRDPQSGCRTPGSSPGAVFRSSCSQPMATPGDSAHQSISPGDGASHVRLDLSSRPVGSEDAQQVRLTESNALRQPTRLTASERARARSLGAGRTLPNTGG